MGKFSIWFYIILAVSIAVLANSVSTIWAGKENKFTSPWFLMLLVVSPLVFITFGLVTSKLGLAVSSGTIDSLLTVSTILVGLFLFGEVSTISIYQYVGITIAVIGIVLMQFRG